MRARQEILARELSADDPAARPGAEVRRRMETAYAECTRRSVPSSVLFVEVTRLDRQATQLGVQMTGVRRAVVESLRKRTGDGDLLACEQGTGILVMLPDTGPEATDLLCRGIIDDAKKLAVAGSPRPIRAALGIGLAHGQGNGALLFETLVLVAREGSSVARNRGGGCFVHTMLYDVMQRRAEELELASVERGSTSDREPTGAPEDAPAEERAARAFRESGVSSAPERLSEPAGEDDLLEGRSLSAGEEIEILRRRIAKLNRALEANQRDLEAAYASIGAMQGIPSDFRGVQGLSANDPDRECKQALLRGIFAANLELRRLCRMREASQEGRASAPERVAAPELASAVR